MARPSLGLTVVLALVVVTYLVTKSWVPSLVALATSLGLLFAYRTLMGMKHWDEASVLLQSLDEEE